MFAECLAARDDYPVSAVVFNLPGRLCRRCRARPVRKHTRWGYRKDGYCSTCIEELRLAYLARVAAPVRPAAPPAPEPSPPAAERVQTLTLGPDGTGQAGVADFSPAELVPAPLLAALLVAAPTERTCRRCTKVLSPGNVTGVCKRHNHQQNDCTDCGKWCQGERCLDCAIAHSTTPRPRVAPAFDPALCVACQGRPTALAGVCRGCYAAFGNGALTAGALERLRAVPPGSKVLRPCAHYEAGCRLKAEPSGTCAKHTPAPPPRPAHAAAWPVPAWLRRAMVET